MRSPRLREADFRQLMSGAGETGRVHWRALHIYESDEDDA
jgi:hypothetical protein